MWVDAAMLAATDQIDQSELCRPGQCTVLWLHSPTWYLFSPEHVDTRGCTNWPYHHWPQYLSPTIPVPTWPHATTIPEILQISGNVWRAHCAYDLHCKCGRYTHIRPATKTCPCPLDPPNGDDKLNNYLKPSSTCTWNHKPAVPPHLKIQQQTLMHRCFSLVMQDTQEQAWHWVKGVMDSVCHSDRQDPV